MSDSPRTRYQQLIDSGQVSPDTAQQSVVDELQLLFSALQDTRTEISASGEAKKSWWKSLFSTHSHTPDEAQPQVYGLYIWGDVGRGKSLLMDMFYDIAPVTHKLRIHFHAFMLDIHSRIHLYRQQQFADPLSQVAKDIALEAKLLCFDEFQVTDIADAMILGRLFDILFDQGVIVVATSNRIPDELYKDGIQREQFLPFIERLKSQLKVIKLDGEKDHRLEKLRSIGHTYHYPLDKKADNFIHNACETFMKNGKTVPWSVTIKGRTLSITRTCGDVALACFDELCKETLGAEDYIEIAKEFHTLILENIPQMQADNRNEAKRFVTLIDELYEHKVQLICSADVAPDKLYTSGSGSFEFDRTVSRLLEMQSDEYMTRQHIE